MNLINWIKNNKLAFVLLIIVAFIVYNSNFTKFSAKNFDTSLRSQTQEIMPATGGLGIGSPSFESAPQPEVQDRLVVQESNISLLVDKVSETTDKITQFAKDKGGYLVSSHIQEKEEAPFATVVIRIPQDKLKEALSYFESLSIRVTSLYEQGRDVTDQYVDLEARLQTLEKTKAKFEEILTKSFSVQDILQVQRELINLQAQIDNLKGRQDYLEKTAQNAKVTIYLSTDEWALPYQPSQPFRPQTIFKQAVRSLILAFRSIIKAIIWIGVFAVIWVPALIIYRFFKKKKKK